jgi:hypothetical protein
MARTKKQTNNSDLNSIVQKKPQKRKLKHIELTNRTTNRKLNMLFIVLSSLIVIIAIKSVSYSSEIIRSPALPSEMLGKLIRRIEGLAESAKMVSIIYWRIYYFT